MVCSANLKVGRRAREGLHVDAPLFRVEVEGFQRTLLAELLHLRTRREEAAVY